MKKYLYIILAAGLFAQPLCAQNNTKPETSTKTEKVSSKAKSDTTAVTIPAKGWYAGLGAAASFGTCTFRSFSDSGNNFDGMGLIDLGYKFNKFISLGAEISAGSVTTTAMDCCAGYWLGPKNERFITAEAPSTDCRSYSSLKSRAKVYGAQLQLSFNLLALCKDSRWTLNLTPMAGYIATRTSLTGPDASGKNVSTSDESGKFQFGYGGQLSLGYALNTNCELKLYGGIDRLTDTRFDGIPYYYSDIDGGHVENFIYNGGIKIIWHFNHK